MIVRVKMQTNKEFYGKGGIQKVVQLDNNFTQDDIYNLLKNAVEKRNELQEESSRFYQNIRDKQESEMHKINMREQDQLREDQIKAEKTEPAS